MMEQHQKCPPCRAKRQLPLARQSLSWTCARHTGSNKVRLKAPVLALKCSAAHSDVTSLLPAVELLSQYYRCSKLNMHTYTAATTC
jgi:hypothetical protein